MRVYELKSWCLSWPFKIKPSTLVSACKLWQDIKVKNGGTRGEHLQVEHFNDTVAVLEPLQQTDLIAEPIHHLQSCPLQVNDLQRTDVLLGVQYHVHLQQSKPADSFTDPSLQSLRLLLPRPSGVSGQRVQACSHPYRNYCKHPCGLCFHHIWVWWIKTFMLSSDGVVLLSRS